ncbi:MAG: hypothetical protein KBC33_01870 [Candidatus Pacebacteria bacterium]|nr:hypothetical protein [Candidatus Paceibacterota bacterium]
MNQEEGHKKLIATILILLLILLTAAFLLYWLRPQETTPQIALDDATFSPFDRPVDRVVDTRAPEDPYTYIPTLETPIEKPREPEIINSAPAVQSSFYTNTPTQTFNIPSVPERTTPTTYSIDSGGVSVPIYSNGAYYQPVYTYSTSTRTTTQPSAQGDDMTFRELDKEVFGYISGLGWTQLLGDVGQQVYDILYGMSPNGTTGATLGNFLPGAGGSSGGGGIPGFGGGGGGALMEFGGRVSRVTQCTCSASSMLDIEDVRGQPISLIFQPGASMLYREANINGVGQNVLGNYTSGGTCLVYHGEDCTAEGSPSGTITQIGTSK